MVFFGSNSNRDLNRHRRIANGATYFPFWEDGRLVQDRYAATVRTQLSYGPSSAGVAGIGDIELVWASGIGTRHLLTDHRGSVVKLQNKVGTVLATREYNAFGQTLSETGTWLEEVPYGYQSNWQRVGFDRPSANGAGTSAPLYLSPTRVYDAETGRFLQRDPLGNKAGMNQYIYCSQNPVNAVDPKGTEPCLSDCTGLTEDPKVKDKINKLYQDAITTAFSDKIRTPGNIRKIIENKLISGGGGFITGIEKKIKKEIDSGKITGAKKCEKKDMLSPSAWVILIDGHCIGTDKLGHFIEEGLLYYDVSKQKGESFAIALGYWMEGLVPPNLTKEIYDWLVKQPEAGKPREPNLKWLAGGEVAELYTGEVYGLQGDTIMLRSIDPNGGSGPADIAANEAGLKFWKDILDSPGASDKSKPVFQFDIGKYINKDWDHVINKNVQGAFRGTPLPGPSVVPYPPTPQEKP